MDCMFPNHKARPHKAWMQTHAGQSHRHQSPKGHWMVDMLSPLGTGFDGAKYARLTLTRNVSSASLPVVGP